MSRLTDRQEQALQAIGQVAQLGGLQIKKVTIADDLQNVSLTVTFTGVSKGWVQESLPIDVEDLRVTLNGRYEVMDLQKSNGLQTGDLAETGAEADELIAAEAAGKDPDDDDEKPDIHMVGEVAAAARTRKRRS